MSIRGRPRSFDRQQALQQAMKIFWAKGYDATQLSELTKAMDITPSSFYAAFNSKETIFREAVELYLKSDGADSMRALANANTAREAISAMLLASVDTVLASPEANGCLLILGLVNCAPENKDLHIYLKQLRLETTYMIRERLKDGLSKSELPPHIDADQLANFYFTVMQGLSLQARDGANRQQLLQVIQAATAVLDTNEPQQLR